MEYQKYDGNLKELRASADRTVVLGGLSPAPLARLLSELAHDRGETILVLVPTALEAEDLVTDISFFWPAGKSQIHLFPAYEAKPFLSQSTALDILALRTLTLYHLAVSSGPRIIVSTPAALLRLVPDPRASAQRLEYIEPGSELNLEKFKAFLAASGYVAVGQVESRGDFSARGGILDIFPPSYSLPVRLEFFGDQVESVRSFQVHDQRSVATLNELLILPISEQKYDRESGSRAAGRLVDLARTHGWLELLWQPVAERLRDGESFSGLESWSPLFEELSPLGTYLNEKIGVLLYEPERFFEAAEASWLNLRNHFDRLAQEERPHLPMESLYREPDEMMEEFQRASGGHWLARKLSLPPAEKRAHHYWRIPVEENMELKALAGLPQRSGAGLLGPLAARVRGLLGRGYEVDLILRTKEQSRRLAEMLAEYDLSSKPASTGSKSQGRLSLTIGQLSSGFASSCDHRAYITEDEIFGTPRRRRRAAAELKGLHLTGLKDLNPSDYVVHNIHGIGQYLGLVTLNLSYGQKGDFLHLAYKGGDKLYVPVELFNSVSKYVGASDYPPALDRLGGQTWNRLKNKVKENIRQMADELLKLYASRQITPGHAFGSRDNIFREFEASFEYTETPDQAAAIDEVLADLASPRPMDRLICGDVGYGKTEVAMRAAFKVVAENKQVAILVPTTILAEQHEQTFSRRLAPWPVEVASLSRFKKPAEQKEILKKTAAGQVDILVGTHRLLQKDVKFKDLGLLIIDEEHRFGVADKEKLKKMRTQVDVLAMSATPIPRSLSMSLSEIRDLSSIATPPQDRLAIKTSLIKYEDEAVCEAIDREIARGGQVFLIHNRVKDIHLWAGRLRRLMPLVNFGVGHGQMKEQELEEVMRRFLSREIDVWITTAIVESGLDFPAANTIIIDQADRFGLAQLYQLRGRVGRGHQQAYAYLMVNDPDTLTAEAQKRLKALLDNTELGSGYQIALHDLQIRGSGNILGAAQSGQASLVGYEMYTQLMEEAVSELKGLEYTEDFDPEVVMGLPAYLPERYAPDMASRLMIYRRLASARTEEDIRDLIEEIRDRFGPLPDEALNLVELMEIKVRLKKARIRRLETGEGGLTLTFEPSGPVNYDKVMALVTDRRRKIRLSPSGKMFIGDITLKSRGDLTTIKNFLPGLV